MEEHQDGKRPLPSDSRTEPWIAEVNKLRAPIMESERRLEELKRHIESRNKAASSGQRSYADESRDADGKDLLDAEQRYTALLARRDELERKICRVQRDRLLVEFEDLTARMNTLSQNVKPAARRAIKHYNKSREALREVSESEQPYARLFEQAGRMRGMILKLDPSCTPKFEGLGFPAHVGDLQRKMLDGLRALGSDAAVYALKEDMYPLLCEPENFTFDEDDEEFDDDDVATPDLMEDDKKSEIEIAIAGPSDEDEDEAQE